MRHAQRQRNTLLRHLKGGKRQGTLILAYLIGSDNELESIFLLAIAVGCVFERHVVALREDRANISPRAPAR